MFAPACSSQSMGCTAVNNGDPATTKRRAHKLAFVQTVSLEGSEWVRPLVDTLALVQDFSDFFGTDDDSVITFEQTAVGRVERPGVAASALTFAQILTFAGCLCGEGGEGEGGLTPISAIFDANTQPGMAVYVSSNGHVDLAQADDITTSVPVGLAIEPVLATGTGDYITCTQLTLEDWTAVIGTQFLTPGSIYFLSETDAGLMTVDAPDQTGDFVIIMGSALTQTTFNIEIHRAYVVG